MYQQNQNIFPKWLCNRAVMAYFAALIVVTIMMNHMAMSWYWFVFGAVEILGFFYGTQALTRDWARLSEKQYEKHLFRYGFFIRVLAVFLLYWFFDTMTGQPFMFHAADSFEYGEEGKWVASLIRSGDLSIYWNYISGKNAGVSDVGYPFYVGLIYAISDDSVILVRILKALYGAYTALLMYRVAKRHFGDRVARLVGIMTMLMPALIIFCGMHLKETEMLFILAIFLNQADQLLLSRNFSFRSIMLTFAAAGGLLFFRTVLAVAAFGSLVVALVLSSQRVASLGRRWMIFIASMAILGYFAGGKIAMEVESLWNSKGEFQQSRLSVQQKTNDLARYASSAVFAPLIFTIPFPTMVETDGQENSRMLHGDLFIKNVLSGFCLFALIMLVVSGDWRKHVLLASLLGGYLIILVFSAFAAAQRFHMPAYPLEILFAGYGINLCVNTPKYKRWSMFWVIVCFVFAVGWNWFKLKGRGMI